MTFETKQIHEAILKDNFEQKNSSMPSFR